MHCNFENQAIPKLNGQHSLGKNTNLNTQQNAQNAQNAN